MTSASLAISIIDHLLAQARGLVDKHAIKQVDRLFAQFSFPGGISSHVSSQTPGSINKGHELRYSIRHAGSVRNSALVLACVVGAPEGKLSVGKMKSTTYVKPTMISKTTSIFELCERRRLATLPWRERRF
jgi:phosphoketolase